MFKGLDKEGQAVDLDNGNICICLHTNKTYRVNGEECKAGGNSYPYTNQVIVPKGATVETLAVTPERVVAYFSPEGKELSYAEWKSRINDLDEQYMDEDGYVQYPDLETEFRVRKELEELKKYTPIVAEEVREWVPLKVEIIGSAADTGSKFIDSAIHLGSLKFSGGGLFKVFTGAIALDQFNKYCSENNIRCENSTHSNIEYAKVLGDYIFTKSEYNWIKQGDRVRITNTLEEAKRVEKEVRDYVTNRIKIKVAEKQPKQLGMAEVSEVLNKVRAIKNRVGSIESKAKTQLDKNQAWVELNALTTLLEQIMIKENN